MSAFGPLYVIPNLIKDGIAILENQKNAKKEKYATLAEIKRKINVSASSLTPLEVEKVILYLEDISVKLETISTNFSLLGLDISKKESEEESNVDEIQMLFKRMIIGQEYDLMKNLGFINSALKIISIAKEEISSYLPRVLENNDGVVIKKVRVEN